MSDIVELTDAIWLLTDEDLRHIAESKDVTSCRYRIKDAMLVAMRKRLTTLKAQGITKPDDGRDHAQNTASQAQDSQNVSSQNSQKAWPQDEALSVLENNCWDLRCITTATDEAGCSDVHWVVIGHFMNHPQEREMGFGDTPIEAFRDAVRQKIGEADLPSEFK